MLVAILWTMFFMIVLLAVLAWMQRRSIDTLALRVVDLEYYMIPEIDKKRAPPYEEGPEMVQ